MSVTSVEMSGLILPTLILIVVLGQETSKITDTDNKRTSSGDENFQMFTGTPVPLLFDSNTDNYHESPNSISDSQGKTEAEVSAGNHVTNMVHDHLLFDKTRPTVNEHTQVRVRNASNSLTLSDNLRQNEQKVASDNQNRGGAVHKLHRDLFRSYNKLIKPKRNQEEAVDASIRIQMYQIRKLNEREQILTSLFWISLYWSDEFLSWDPENYNGTKRMFVDSDLIWKPDIYLLNNEDKDTLTSLQLLRKSESSLSYTGSIYYCVPVLAQTVCEVNVAHYPFDSHRCDLLFSTWQRSIDDVNLTVHSSPVGLEKYVNHSEWDLESFTYDFKRMVYPCCPETFYPEPIFTLFIRRKPLYVIFHLILPPLFQDIIGLLVFLVPPDCGERVSLSINLVLAISLFQMLVMESTPATSESLSLASLFLGGSIFLHASVTGMSVIVVYLQHQGARNHGKPPRWLDELSCGLLGPCLGLSYSPARAEQTYTAGENMELPKSDNSIKNEEANSLSGQRGEDEMTSEVTMPSGILTEMPLELRELRKDTQRRMTQNVMYCRDEQDGVSETDWKYHARVLNRFFMASYMGGIVILSISLGIKLYI